MRCYRSCSNTTGLAGSSKHTSSTFAHCERPFDPALLEDLRRDAAETVRFEGDDVVIDHAYVERRIRPLNLFLAEEDPDAVKAAARDYGQALKDLAASNIFPGDIFTKNFGVTRHGRVVFYDYDELSFVTDCNFRKLPQATTHEEEMAAEPWYSVRENDIFPEEFSSFLRWPNPHRPSFSSTTGIYFDRTSGAPCRNCDLGICRKYFLIGPNGD